MNKIILKLIFLLKEKFYNQDIEDNIDLNQSLNLGTGIISGILQHLLEKNKWDSGNWIDDVILRDINKKGNLIYIYGSAIYGKSNTTKEWVSPFLLEISLTEGWIDFIDYKCYFDRQNADELDYIEYRNNRNEWDKYFYDNYNKPNSSWLYIICDKKDKE